MVLSMGDEINLTLKSDDPNFPVHEVTLKRSRSQEPQMRVPHQLGWEDQIPKPEVAGVPCPAVGTWD